MPAAVIRLIVTMALLLVATVLSPLAPASADPTAGGSSADPSPAGTAATVPSASARAGRATPLRTRLTAKPTAITITGKATFRYAANVPGAQFRCRLRGPGRATDKFKHCPGGTAANTSAGVKAYANLAASRSKYTFVVLAFIPRSAGTAEVTGTQAAYGFRHFSVYSPGHYSPANGASYNRPMNPRYQRTNLTKVIRFVNSMPGYKQAATSMCPRAGALVPSTIRMSAYSITDGRVAKALVAAHKRCVSVQVLMNNHLSRTTDPAWRTLENAFGTRVFGSEGRSRRSFAHRCSSGCRGSGVLHTKMYLFNSTLLDPSRNKIRYTTAVGSSNMTSNAAEVQWNDLYTVRGRADLYGTFLRVFNLMKADNGVHRKLIQVNNGIYQSTFWPQARGAADPTMQMLKSVHCTGANGGTGIGGHSVVYINMHAWFGTRGLGLANQVRKMYNNGCYVRVLYSFMSYGVFKKLHSGTGSRMSVRRTTFSHNGRTAYVYSHFKNTSVSGYVGKDRSAKVVWTGSNNFTNDGTHFDEVTLRIASASAYRSYVNQFKSISRTKSSAVYAHLSEPSGGGRAPKRLVAGSLTGGAQVEAPTAGAITFDEDGNPHALD